MPSCPDVPIIGSGVGGGTLAYRLVQHGLTVTILERGGFLPTEPPDIPPYPYPALECGKAPRGVANSSGVVGRNYMPSKEKRFGRTTPRTIWLGISA